MERIRECEIAEIEILVISGKRKRVEDKLGVELRICSHPHDQM